MNIIRDSSPEEVVLIWLQAELESERFGEDLKKSLDKYNLNPKFITCQAPCIINTQSKPVGLQSVTILSTGR